MSDIVSKNIDIFHCSLHCLAAGEEQGHDIVLLHGMKFQAATWQELGTLGLLADLGMRAFALDMPGFGKSPACEAEQDEVLARFVDRETTGRPILLGPSMGGRIALEFAVNHPDTLSALILVGAVGVEENRARLAEIKVPTLLIWGGEDQIS
ncbi:MAG: alpha/beta fold hydrolase, partial [Desulfobulbaceae bacterium]|nr:alpha/beta fold hydrolase [Desulfobulbaceae bacterium]